MSARVIAALHLLTGVALAIAPAALLVSIRSWTTQSVLSLAGFDLACAALVAVLIPVLTRPSKSGAASRYRVTLLGVLLLWFGLFASYHAVRLFSVALGVWLITLGVRIARGTRGICQAVVATHVLLLFLGLVFVASGVWMLRAAERSAGSGGGLLGGFGAVLAALGGLFLAVSVPTLLWLRTPAARACLVALLLVFVMEAKPDGSPTEGVGTAVAGTNASAGDSLLARRLTWS